MSGDGFLVAEVNVFKELVSHFVDLFFAEDFRIRNRGKSLLCGASLYEVVELKRRALISTWRFRLLLCKCFRQGNFLKLFKKNNNPFFAFIEDFLDLSFLNIRPVSLLAIIVLFEDFIELAQQTRVGLISED